MKDYEIVSFPDGRCNIVQSIDPSLPGVMATFYPPNASVRAGCFIRAYTCEPIVNDDRTEIVELLKKIYDHMVKNG